MTIDSIHSLSGLLMWIGGRIFRRFARAALLGLAAGFLLAAGRPQITAQGAERLYLPVALGNRPAMTIVSRHTNGTQANGNSVGGQMSADGRYVIFSSTATNLVDGDQNGFDDVFIHDRQTGQTTIFQRPPANDPTTGRTYGAAISPNGRFVAFLSDLRVGDPNIHYRDLFVYDRQSTHTTLVSRHTNGTPGNLNSRSPALSADGRYVAFVSGSTNLIDNDANRFYDDIYVHDRQTGQTTLISRHTDGTQGSRQSDNPAISADGRFVAFESMSNNLTPSDANDDSDVFVHDRQTGQTTLISRALGGGSGNDGSWSARLSADGRYVTFSSQASDLVNDDTQICSQIRSCIDIFVHDRQTGQTRLVSRHSSGTPGNNAAFSPAISTDGRFVAFISWSDNLAEDDVNDDMDVFVHDRQTGQTALVSYHIEESPIIRGFGEPYLSADGRFVSFMSEVPNLVADDRNGKWDIFVYDRGPANDAP